MKLYIWRSVLNDWGQGNITVMAESEEQARALVAAESDWYTKEIEGKDPEVHYKPYAIFNHGSA